MHTHATTLADQVDNFILGICAECDLRGDDCPGMEDTSCPRWEKTSLPCPQCLHVKKPISAEAIGKLKVRDRVYQCAECGAWYDGLSDVAGCLVDNFLDLAVDYRYVCEKAGEPV